MSNNAKMDTATFEGILNNLDEKVKNVKAIFDDIEKNMTYLNGEYKTWQGRAQEIVYSKYKLTAEKFPAIKEKLDDYLEFLKNTLDYYKKEEQSLENSVENNAEDLNII